MGFTKRITSIAICLVLILTIFSGCKSVFPDEEVELAPPVIEPKQITYKTQAVVRGDIEDVKSVNGEIVPIEIEYQYVTLKGSRLKEVHVKLGERVEAGQLLVEFESDSIKDQIKAKEHAINTAQANYDTSVKVYEIDALIEEDAIADLEEAILEVDTDIEALKSDQIEALMDQIAAIELSYDKMVLNYDLSIKRKEYAVFMEDSFGANNYYKDDRLELVETDLENTLQMQQMDTEEALNNIAELEADIAELDETFLEDSTDQKEALQEQIDSQKLIIEKSLINRMNNLTIMSNNLVLDRYYLTQLYADLADTTMNAAISGDIVFIRDMEEGDYINDYDKLIGIADESDYYVLYEGGDAEVFHQNDSVNIIYNNGDYDGVVVQTPNEAPDGMESQYEDLIKINLSQIPDGLRRGEDVKIELVIESATDTLIIPKSAVFESANDVLVYVLENGVKKERYIKLGVENATEVEVLEGLEEGELLVLN